MLPNQVAESGLRVALLAAVCALVCGCGAATAEPASTSALEKQLAEARVRMDAAAREVADLSRRLYGAGSQEIIKIVQGEAPQGAMLGIDIDSAQPPQAGVLVRGTRPEGPAAKAGIVAGDVVVAVDGKPLQSGAQRDAVQQLVEHMRGVKPGQVVKVDLMRGGKPRTVAVTAAAPALSLIQVIREPDRLPGMLGQMLPEEFELMLGRPPGDPQLVSITPKLGQYFGTDKGLLVVKVLDSARGLEEGDVILSIGGREPADPDHAMRIFGSYQPGEKVGVEIMRNRKRLSTQFVIPARPPGPPPRPTGLAPAHPPGRSSSPPPMDGGPA